MSGIPVLEAWTEQCVDVGMRRAQLAAMLMDGKDALDGARRPPEGLLDGIPKDSLRQTSVEAGEALGRAVIDRENEAEGRRGNGGRCLAVSARGRSGRHEWSDWVRASRRGRWWEPAFGALWAAGRWVQPAPVSAAGLQPTRRLLSSLLRLWRRGGNLTGSRRAILYPAGVGRTV